ncbi:CHAP domain-containing protein [Streptococcus thermophilus]
MLIIILFKMGDLFFSIASQYSVATYQLVAENGMTIWSRLVLGGTSDISGTATADEDISEIFYSEVTVTDTDIDSMWNRYLVGQCTWGVKEITLWGSNWWCNGGDWAGRAASQGYAVGSISAACSIVCWTGGGY